jgi:aminoglycoside 6'-N-acetyltransferase
LTQRLSVGAAVAVGMVWINVPALALILSGIGLAGMVTEWLKINAALAGFWFPVVFLGLMLSGFVAGWLWWSVMVPRWKLWAYSRVHRVAKLKDAAVAAGLIWGDGNVFEKTEIASKSMRLDIFRLEGRLKYGFRPMTADDLAMVNGWINEPHVSQWWIDAAGASEPMDESDFEQPDFNMWIVSRDEKPFAYLQDYNPHLYPGHHFFDRPEGARGIDQIIGVPDMAGKGHGPAFIRQHMERLFDDGVPVVVTDPHPQNARAIRAYKKAGFIAYGEIISPKWGPSLLMQCVR